MCILTCLCLNVYVCMCVCAYVCMCVCAYVRMCVCSHSRVAYRHIRDHKRVGHAPIRLLRDVHALLPVQFVVTHYWTPSVTKGCVRGA